VALEEGPAEQAFQPLDLQADGGLGTENPLGALRKTTGLCNGQEGAKKLAVQLPGLGRGIGKAHKKHPKHSFLKSLSAA